MKKKLIALLLLFTSNLIISSTEPSLAKTKELEAAKLYAFGIANESQKRVAKIDGEAITDLSDADLYINFETYYGYLEQYKVSRKVKDFGNAEVLVGFGKTPPMTYNEISYLVEAIKNEFNKRKQEGKNTLGLSIDQAKIISIQKNVFKNFINDELSLSKDHTDLFKELKELAKASLTNDDNFRLKLKAILDPSFVDSLSAPQLKEFKTLSLKLYNLKILPQEFKDKFNTTFNLNNPSEAIKLKELKELAKASLTNDDNFRLKLKAILDPLFVDSLSAPQLKEFKTLSLKLYNAKIRDLHAAVSLDLGKSRFQAARSFFKPKPVVNDDTNTLLLYNKVALKKAQAAAAQAAEEAAAQEAAELAKRVQAEQQKQQQARDKATEQKQQQQKQQQQREQQQREQQQRDREITARE